MFCYCLCSVGVMFLVCVGVLGLLVGVCVLVAVCDGVLVRVGV